MYIVSICASGRPAARAEQIHSRRSPTQRNIRPAGRGGRGSKKKTQNSCARTRRVSDRQRVANSIATHNSTEQEKRNGGERRK